MTWDIHNPYKKDCQKEIKELKNRINTLEGIVDRLIEILYDDNECSIDRSYILYNDEYHEKNKNL